MAKRRVAAKGILRFWSFQFGMKSGPESGTCHVPELILQFPLLTLMTTNLIVGRNQINKADAKILESLEISLYAYIVNAKCQFHVLKKEIKCNELIINQY